MEAEVAPTRRRARAGLLAATLVVVLLAAGGWIAIRGGGLGRPATAAAAPEIPTGTAVVARTDVVSRQQVSGTLGYEGSFAVVGHVADVGGGGQAQGGIVTRLPAPGAVVRRGRVVYELDGRPVPLWYGTRPAWRDFQSGMADGPDVQALETNLVALGFDPGRAITVDGHFTAATRAAVRRWQDKALGLPPALRTGAIPLGGVVFLPGPVRIAAVAATVGTAVQPGTPILTATSTRPVVSVSLPPSFQQLVRRGARVQVILPDGTATPGTVATVSRAAVVPDPAAGQEGQGQGGGPQEATIPLTVRLTRPGAAKGLDQAPVGVAITTETHRGVLAVPITALLAEPGGGYAVEVVEGGTRRRVPVKTDLFDESSGVVEVDGPGLAAGTTVVVPAQ
ncbi:MAG TPA: peptidoglycan-binding protein [Actinomycetota bacterium]|jgi:peptidoglycan hydrolase-like protein with peptidoglycan-binding domain|nr:peptidoglycan-binding protein [Actinomycetota bacterium]